jgi:hypothetical protein
MSKKNFVVKRNVETGSGKRREAETEKEKTEAKVPIGTFDTTKSFMIHRSF